MHRSIDPPHRCMHLYIHAGGAAPSLQRLRVDPLSVGGAPSGEVNVTVALRGAEGMVVLGICFDLPFDAQCPHASQYPLVGGVVSLHVAVPQWKTWSPAHPNLHTLTAVLHSAGVVVDSIQVRFGLRTVSTSGRHILVNGAPIKLRGFNRHDMYPQLGPSLPNHIYDSDLDLLQVRLGSIDLCLTECLIAAQAARQFHPGLSLPTRPSLPRSM